MQKKVYRADIVKPLSRREAEYLSPGYLLVDEAGKVIEVSADHEKWNLPDFEKVNYEGRILLPGLIDIHSHLPQYACTGLGPKDLLVWLNNYIFKQELSFCDAAIARSQARHFFSKALAYGTTTIVSYITTSAEATDVAFEEAQSAGIRAFLGPVMMDQNAPKDILVPAERAVKETVELIRKWHGREKLNLILTPRFAISCSPEILSAAGELANEFDLRIQTHLSENLAEVREAVKLHPYADSYTDIYAKNGLLKEGTLLAHCIHLSEQERVLIREAGGVIAHCASSNRFLGSGAMRFREYEKEGLMIALGSDVAAGLSLSMVHEAGEALLTSRSFEEPMSPEEALYSATCAASEALGIDDQVHGLDSGKAADFVIFHDKMTHPLYGESETLPYHSLPERLQRLLLSAETPKAHSTFIQGKRVYSSPVFNDAKFAR